MNTTPRDGRVRVAMLIHTMAYGGVETTVLNWTRALDPARFDVRLVCFENSDRSEQPFVDAAARLGLTVSKIPWGRHKPLIRAARTMARYIREWGVDVLHCHNPYGNLIGFLTRVFVPVRTMTTLYLWGEFGFRQKLLEAVDRLVLHSFDLVSAHCEQAVRQTVERGISEKNVKLLLSGFAEHPAVLSTSVREEARREFGAGRGDFVLLNIARFWPEKAHDVLLRGFRLILNSHPHAKLWLAGVGPLEQDTRSLAQSLELGDAVQFIGFQPNLPRLLALADMQVHPSHIEGVPLAICSGMAAGLPIVATAVGGIPEVIRSGRNGILVPPASPETFAQAVSTLLNDKVTRDHLGAEARRFIQEEYSLDAAARRLGQTYEELLGDASSAPLAVAGGFSR